MSDKVRLWRTHEMVVASDDAIRRSEWHEERVADDSYAYPDSEWIARPAADDEALLRALMKSSLDAGAWKATADAATSDRDEWRARAERAEAALADAVKAERARIAKHMRDLGLAGPAKDVERCPSCYDLGVVGAADEPCTAVACDAHAAKVREDAARRAKA